MRKKVKQKEEKKLTYTTWQNTLYIFRGVFRWCKPLLIFISIGAVTETAIPFIGLFLGKLVIEQVEKGAKTGQLLSILVVVALLGFIFLGVSLLILIIIFGTYPFCTVSLVIMHFSIFGFEGMSNIISLIISSIIALNPLAPVFLSIALSTIAFNASFSNSS